MKISSKEIIDECAEYPGCLLGRIDFSFDLLKHKRTQVYSSILHPFRYAMRVKKEKVNMSVLIKNSLNHESNY